MAVFRPYEYAEKEQLFSQVASQYNRLIAGICLSFAQNREEFDDLRQDALLNVWRGLDKFKGHSSVSTWIYRVALNTCVSAQRKARKPDRESIRELVTELYDNSSPEDQERYSIMYRMIERLKPLDKSVILLWLEEKSYDEISEVMGMSRNAVASRLKRAKECLTNMYKQHKD